MKSRRIAIAGVAALAALAGAGVAWWRLRPEEGGDASALWPLTFETPHGQPLSMASLRGKPVLVNFWATWCPPCVEEMPLLDAFYREQAANGWQVIGLAIDQPSKVRDFLKRSPVSYPIGFAGLEGTQLARSLGNEQGGLPFSVVVSPGGTVRERRMGRLHPGDLQGWAAQA